MSILSVQKYTSFCEAGIQVLNVHANENVSKLLEKFLNTFALRTFNVECPAGASIENDASLGKLSLPSANDDPGAAQKQLEILHQRRM